MNKSQNVILVVLIIIALTIVGVGYWWVFTPHSKVTEVIPTATTTPQAGLTVTPKTVKEEDTVKKYIINVSYPQVSGLSNKQAENEINNTLTLRMQTLINDFKESSGDVIVEDDDNSTLDVDYVEELHTTIPDIISFKVNESYFEAGAAHPGQTIETFNFNSKTGQLLTLNDLFDPSSDYLKKISEYSVAELKKKLGYSDQLSQGAAPKPDNYTAFLVTETGLKVIFNQYQVAAYAAGVQEVTIPYRVLASYINKNGPLGVVVNQ